jgi:hypothetical protein
MLYQLSYAPTAGPSPRAALFTLGPALSFWAFPPDASTLQAGAGGPRQRDETVVPNLLT